MQSVSLDAILAFKGASLFIRLLTIRCGRFKNSLLCLGTSPLPSPQSHPIFLQPGIKPQCYKEREKGGMYCTYNNCSSAFILYMYIFFFKSM